VEPKLKVLANVGFYMDFGCNESAPRIIQGAIQVEPKWNIGGMLMKP